MENYPVESVVERVVENQVNALVGNNDVNLKTIVKMSMMEEMNQVNKDEMEEVISKIKRNNELEKYYIEQDYELTYDLAGNIIPINCINEGKEVKQDFEGIISKSE
jgi:hypothetical protein